MKEFFGIGGYQRTPEGYMSWQHLLFVTLATLVMVGLAVLIGLIKRRSDYKGKNRVVIITAILFDVIELSRIIFVCCRSDDPWRSFLINLPLFLCTLMAIALPLAAFSKGRLKDAALDFVFIFGILGGLIGNYGAGQNFNAYPVLGYDNVVSVITHCLGGFASIYLGVAGMASMKKKNIWLTFSILLGFCGVAYIADITIPYNYMFLMGGDGTPYDLFYALVKGNKVLYPLTVVLLFLIYIAVFYLVFYKFRKKEAQIIVLAGQSNAVGVGHAECLPMHFPQGTIEKWRTGYEKIKINYYSHDKKSDGFVNTSIGCTEKTKDTIGPELGIAEAISENCPDTEVYIVKCAFGGTSLYCDWLSPSGGQEYDPYAYADQKEDIIANYGVGAPIRPGWCYNELVRILADSIYTLTEKNLKPKVKAFCWMQGEADAITPGIAGQYIRRYDAMISDFKKQFAGYLDDCVFIDAGISEIWPEYKMINEHKRKYAMDHDSYFFIDTIAEGLTTVNEPLGEPDAYHYDSDCVIKLGRLFAQHIKIERS